MDKEKQKKMVEILLWKGFSSKEIAEFAKSEVSVPTICAWDYWRKKKRKRP